MSNNYLKYYNAYYKNPGSSSNKNCCKVCQLLNIPYIIICPTSCAPPCPPPCTDIVYITTATSISVIPGGVPLTSGTITIPPISTGFTPIINFSTTPIVNLCGINLNTTNGQFTVPVRGRYSISASISFTGGGVVNGNITLYIYKIDAYSNIISFLAANTAPASISTETPISYVALSTSADLNAFDRIFYAVTQNTMSTLINSNDSKFIIRSESISK